MFLCKILLTGQNNVLHYYTTLLCITFTKMTAERHLGIIQWERLKLFGYYRHSRQTGSNGLHMTLSTTWIHLIKTLFE